MLKHHACQPKPAAAARGICDPPGLETGLCVIRLMPNQTNFVHKKGARLRPSIPMIDARALLWSGSAGIFMTILARDWTKMKRRTDKAYGGES